MRTELPTLQVLENSTEALRAVAHPIRLQIIAILHESKRLNVSEIFVKLNIEQAIASHHLRILKDQDIVSVRRDGKNAFYTLVDKDYFFIVETILGLQQNNTNF